MFAKIKAWFMGEVNTVEGILSNFHHTIQALEAHAEQKVREVFHLDATIQKAAAMQAAAADEALKARAAADQIKKIEPVASVAPPSTNPVNRETP